MNEVTYFWSGITIGLAGGLICGLWAGVQALYWYQVYRIRKQLVRNGGDTSNWNNPARLLQQVIVHPTDFGKLQYPDGKKPFGFVYLDEFSQVVDSRPNE